MGDVAEGQGSVAAAGDSMQAPTSLPPPGSGAPASASAPPEVQQWTQAVQQWQAIAGQGQQARKNGQPFYPLGAAHPYGLWAGQVQVYLLLVSGAIQQHLPADVVPLCSLFACCAASDVRRALL